MTAAQFGFKSVHRGKRESARKSGSRLLIAVRWQTTSVNDSSNPLSAQAPERGKASDFGWRAESSINTTERYLCAAASDSVGRSSPLPCPKPNAPPKQSRGAKWLFRDLDFTNNKAANLAAFPYF